MNILKIINKGVQVYLPPSNADYEQFQKMKQTSGKVLNLILLKQQYFFLKFNDWSK